MLNLIKTECYKLGTSKLFLILLSITFALNTAFIAAGGIVTKVFSQGQPVQATELSQVLVNPFAMGLLMIPMFISAVSFLSLDFTGGYVKNIAGQLPDRGSMVISKYVVIGLHNLIFFVVAALSGILGTAIGTGVAFDTAIGAGVLTLLLKWLLSMALCSILLFLAVGIGNKVFATIMAVIFASGSLSLLYMGISMGAENIFKLNGFNLGNYLPDSLIGSVNVADNTLVVNGIIVSVVFIALFVVQSYITFKKKDVK